MTFWMILAFFVHPHYLHPCKGVPTLGSLHLQLSHAGWLQMSWLEAILLGVQRMIQAARTVISFSYTLLIRNR